MVKGLDTRELKMRRVLQLPKPPALPTKFPLEDEIGNMVEKVINLAEKDPVLGVVNRAIDSIPIVPERSFETPWGTYKTPELYIPKVLPITLDGRQREAFKAAVMADLAGLAEAIPFMGAAAKPLADSLEDTAMAKIQDTLTPEEKTQFQSYDKVDPLTVVAMVRTMVRTQRERR